MRKIKIKIAEYVALKNKLKFLEFYWSQLDNQNFNKADYHKREQVEYFIANNLFQDIHSLKQNFFSKTVTVSRKTSDLLNEYGPISDELKQLSEQDAHKITPGHDII